MRNHAHIVAITKNNEISLVNVRFSWLMAFWKAIELQNPMALLSNGTMSDAVRHVFRSEQILFPKISRVRTLQYLAVHMLHAIWEPRAVCTLHGAKYAVCRLHGTQSADCMATVQTNSFSKFQRNLRFSARINFLTKLPNLKENNLCLFDNGYYSFSCL